jgi:hypothetical protein
LDSRRAAAAAPAAPAEALGPAAMPMMGAEARLPASDPPAAAGRFPITPAAAALAAAMTLFASAPSPDGPDTPPPPLPAPAMPISEDCKEAKRPPLPRVGCDILRLAKPALAGAVAPAEIDLRGIPEGVMDRC